MPRFDQANDADAVLAHPLTEALARYATQTQAPSAVTPEWQTSAPGSVLLIDRPTSRDDPDELWDRLGDFA